jgi:hypothetical protein
LDLAQEFCELGLTAEEFEHDLWLRAKLYKISQKAPAAMTNKFQLRIERADAIFAKCNDSTKLSL